MIKNLQDKGCPHLKKKIYIYIYIHINTEGTFSLYLMYGFSCLVGNNGLFQWVRQATYL